MAEPKDKWDKFDIVSKSAVSVAIALIAGLYTCSQNNLEKQRQAKSTEVETLSKFMPYLSGTDEPAKKAALLAMRRISSTEFMTQIAQLYPSAGAVGALEAVVVSPSATTNERSLASAALTALGLRNPSAEQVIDDSSSSQPAYWIFGSWLPGTAGRHESATDQAHSGTRSFKLSADKPNHLRWGQPVRLDPNSTYLLSAWIRAENVAHSSENNDRGANIAIHFISPDKFPQSSDPLYDTGGEWRYVSLQFTTQGTKTDAEVLLQLGADSGMTSGVVWFDDVSLGKMQ